MSLKEKLVIKSVKPYKKRLQKNCCFLGMIRVDGRARESAACRMWVFAIDNIEGVLVWQTH